MVRILGDSTDTSWLTSSRRSPLASGMPSLRTSYTQAAITAICDGTERITKQSLEAIRLDHLAETHHRPTRTR
ncbi:hypothetical protein SGFS_007010 [Streptomyces graminofaciens]|uniref:Uncharacterized protein n=1 Tax=Streptomyces graminofaciens TaxID=68212 RepID=A0ABM7F113_9ACTN|nr:hypothetical protein SGFS_007010 [Streptomyces graminofaciens]